MGLNKNQEPKEVAEWDHFFFNMKRRDLRAAENSEEQRTQGKMVREGEELITGLRASPQEVCLTSFFTDSDPCPHCGWMIFLRY